MSPTPPEKRKSDKAVSNGSTSNSARRAVEHQEDIIHTSKNKDSTPTINEVEALKKGFISITKKKAPYTILLLGETGVGKSSVLELFYNVLRGNDSNHYKFNVLEPTNEQGGPSNQSQTTSARIYELTSNDGIVVRVLDTPGFPDTPCIPQDDLTKSIATEVQKQTDPVTAVLVLANGTVPRATVGTDSALSALSTIFPQHSTKNVAFVLTNASSPLYQNFSADNIPEALKEAPQFLLNNPVALQKKYLKLKDEANVEQGSEDPPDAVKAEEQHALEMLVELFHWLDNLGPQPTTEKLVPPQHTSACVEKVTRKKAQAQNSAMFALLSGGTCVLSAVGRGRELEARNRPQSGTELVSLLRKVEEMVQEGVMRVRKILVGE